jgi:Flp pilus assembly protein TadB
MVNFFMSEQDLEELRLRLKALEDVKKNESEKKALETKIKVLEKEIKNSDKSLKYDFSFVFQNFFNSYFSKMVGLKTEVKWLLVFGYVFPLIMFLVKGLWLVFFLYLIGYLFALPVMILKLVEKQEVKK